jgi:hypothetical protein
LLKARIFIRLAAFFTGTANSGLKKSDDAA